MLRSSLKSRISKAIIIVLVTASLIITSGCSSSQPATPDGAASPGKEASATLYGAIQTPFPHFRQTEDVPREEYPVVFTRDGKMGYQDKSGAVIVEPAYKLVHEFWNGVGKVRLDNPDGTYTWKSVDRKGNIYDYDEVYGFQFGLSPVMKNGKYGFINTDGELVVPVQYDQLYNAYLDKEKARSSYAQRDGRFVYLNLQEGYEEIFEKYDPAKKTVYARTIALQDYQLAVINAMVVVNGRSDPMGTHFPLTILDGLDFDLFNQKEKLGTFKAKLTGGSYEGEVFVSFPGFQETASGAPDGAPVEYYAVLSGSGQGYREVSEVGQVNSYLETVRQYLRDNRIDNAPVNINRALQGDFLGDGRKGVLLEVNDRYRQGGEPQPIKEKWTTRKFADGKTAFVNALLIIDDMKKPLEYRVLKSNIWTHTDWDYITEKIGYVADFDTDKSMELLIDNRYYEYRDYTLMDLDGTKASYPERTVGIVGNTQISEDTIQLEIRERELTLALSNKLADLFADGNRRTPKETLLVALGLGEKDLNADQKRYLTSLEAQNQPLTANDAFNLVLREEALYQEAVEKGYLVTAEEALAVLKQSDEVTAREIGQNEESRKKYAELIQYETELYQKNGFQDRDAYWNWHAPQTARAATINRFKSKFQQKIRELYPDVDGLAFQIKQENAWQDYTEYLLKVGKAAAVTGSYTLEFSGEAWQHGELELGDL